MCIARSRSSSYGPGKWWNCSCWSGEDQGAHWPIGAMHILLSDTVILANDDSSELSLLSFYSTKVIFFDNPSNQKDYWLFTKRYWKKKLLSHDELDFNIAETAEKYVLYAIGYTLAK